MSFVSKIQRKLDFFALFYYTYLYGMSGCITNSSYQNNEQTVNPRRRLVASPPVPIACRVCDRVFPDNVSLALHFVDSHDIEEVPPPNQRRRTLAALQENHLPLNSPHISCSPMGRISEARPVKLPRTSHYARLCDLFAGPGNPQNVGRKNVSHIQTPALSSMPPLDGRSNACGLTMAPLPLSDMNGGKGSVLVNKRSHIKKVLKPVKETIVISDDEKDGIDLTLRL